MTMDLKTYQPQDRVQFMRVYLPGGSAVKLTLSGMDPLLDTVLVLATHTLDNHVQRFGDSAVVDVLYPHSCIHSDCEVQLPFNDFMLVLKCEPLALEVQDRSVKVQASEVNQSSPRYVAQELMDLCRQHLVAQVRHLLVSSRKMLESVEASLDADNNSLLRSVVGSPLFQNGVLLDKFKDLDSKLTPVIKKKAQTATLESACEDLFWALTKLLGVSGQVLAELNKHWEKTPNLSKCIGLLLLHHQDMLSMMRLPTLEFKKLDADVSRIVSAHSQADAEQLAQKLVLAALALPSTSVQPKPLIQLLTPSLLFAQVHASLSRTAAARQALAMIDCLIAEGFPSSSLLPLLQSVPALPVSANILLRFYHSLGLGALLWASPANASNVLELIPAEDVLTRYSGPGHRKQLVALAGSLLSQSDVLDKKAVAWLNILPPMLKQSAESIQNVCPLISEGMQEYQELASLTNDDAFADLARRKLGKSYLTAFRMPKLKKEEEGTLPNTSLADAVYLDKPSSVLLSRPSPAGAAVARQVVQTEQPQVAQADEEVDVGAFFGMFEDVDEQQNNNSVPKSVVCAKPQEDRLAKARQASVAIREWRKQAVSLPDDISLAEQILVLFVQLASASRGDAVKTEQLARLIGMDCLACFVGVSVPEPLAAVACRLVSLLCSSAEFADSLKQSSVIKTTIDSLVKHYAGLFAGPAHVGRMPNDDAVGRALTFLRDLLLQPLIRPSILGDLRTSADDPTRLLLFELLALDFHPRPVAAGSVVHLKADRLKESYLVVRRSASTIASAYFADYLHYEYDLSVDGPLRGSIAEENALGECLVLHCLRTGSYRLVRPDLVEPVPPVYDPAVFREVLEQLDLEPLLGQVGNGISGLLACYRLSAAAMLASPSNVSVQLAQALQTKIQGMKTDDSDLANTRIDRFASLLHQAPVHTCSWFTGLPPLQQQASAGMLTQTAPLAKHSDMRSRLYARLRRPIADTGDKQPVSNLASFNMYVYSQPLPKLAFDPTPDTPLVLAQSLVAGIRRNASEILGPQTSAANSSGLQSNSSPDNDRNASDFRELFEKAAAQATDISTMARNKHLTDAFVRSVEQLSVLAQRPSAQASFTPSPGDLRKLDIMLGLVAVPDELTNSALFGSWVRVNDFQNVLVLLLRAAFTLFKLELPQLVQQRQAAWISRLNEQVDILRMSDDDASRLDDILIKGIILSRLSVCPELLNWPWQVTAEAGPTASVDLSGYADWLFVSLNKKTQRFCLYADKECRKLINAFENSGTKRYDLSIGFQFSLPPGKEVCYADCLPQMPFFASTELLRDCASLLMRTLGQGKHLSAVNKIAICEDKVYLASYGCPVIFSGISCSHSSGKSFVFYKPDSKQLIIKTNGYEWSDLIKSPKWRIPKAQYSRHFYFFDLLDLPAVTRIMAFVEPVGAVFEVADGRLFFLSSTRDRSKYASDCEHAVYSALQYCFRKLDAPGLAEGLDGFDVRQSDRRVVSMTSATAACLVCVVVDEDASTGADTRAIVWLFKPKVAERVAVIVKFGARKIQKAVTVKGSTVFLTGDGLLYILKHEIANILPTTWRTYASGCSFNECTILSPDFGAEGNRITDITMNEFDTVIGIEEVYVETSDSDLNLRKKYRLLPIVNSNCKLFCNQRLTEQTRFVETSGYNLLLTNVEPARLVSFSSRTQHPPPVVFHLEGSALIESPLTQKPLADVLAATPLAVVVTDRFHGMLDSTDSNFKNLLVKYGSTDVLPADPSTEVPDSCKAFGWSPVTRELTMLSEVPTDFRSPDCPPLLFIAGSRPFTSKIHALITQVVATCHPSDPNVHRILYFCPNILSMTDFDFRLFAEKVRTVWENDLACVKKDYFELRDLFIETSRLVYQNSYNSRSTPSKVFNSDPASLSGISEINSSARIRQGPRTREELLRVFYPLMIINHHYLDYLSRLPVYGDRCLDAAMPRLNLRNLHGCFFSILLRPDDKFKAVQLNIAGQKSLGQTRLVRQTFSLLNLWAHGQDEVHEGIRQRRSVLDRVRVLLEGEGRPVSSRIQ